MKEFAQDKKGVDHDFQAQSRESDKTAQRDRPRHDLAPPMGRRDVLSAARGGDLRARRAMNAILGHAAMAPQSLEQFHPGIASKIARCTGVDISDATVQVDPALDAEGKQGAAEAGERIYLAQMCFDQEKTLCHEGIHVVQARGGSSKGQYGSDIDPEREAVGLSKSHQETVAYNPDVLINIDGENMKAGDEVAVVVMTDTGVMHNPPIEGRQGFNLVFV